MADGDGIGGAGALDTGSGIPLFHQLSVLLRDLIVSGRMEPGARLPSEADLCAEYGVSRITAKRALDELAREGLVERGRGRGTRVAPGRGPVPFVSTVEGWLENISRIADTTAVRVLEFGYLPAPPRIGELLELPPGAEVQRSVRVRAFEGRPLSWLETWVPAEIGRRYSREEMGREPLLRLLERSGLRAASARQTITAALAAPAVARALEVPAGSALLDVRRTVRADDGRPVEHIAILYRPDLYQFAMTLSRVAGEGGARWEADATPAAPEPRRDQTDPTIPPGAGQNREKA